MFTSGEYERINEELNQQLNSRRQKIKKVWFVILLSVSFICGGLILLFPNQFDDGSTAWILPVYGGGLFLTALVGYIVSMKYRSEKPYFEYLYNEVIHKINLNEGLFLDYQAYEKSDKEFNVKGGLFTRMSAIKVRRHIKGKSEKEHNFDIIDCTMTTSNGKSQQVHFDGVYYVLHKQLNTSIQVRSNSSPKLRGVKFDRLKEFEDIRVFKQENDHLSNVDHMLIKFVQKLSEFEKYKKVSLGVIDGEIHVGIAYRKHPLRKPKEFNLITLNRISNDLFDEIKFINDLELVDNFEY